MLTLIALIASLTSICVNLFTLWSVRKTLIKGAKNAINEVKEVSIDIKKVVDKI